MKEVDWTKPIRWSCTKVELHHVGLMPDGRRVVCPKDAASRAALEIVCQDCRGIWLCDGSSVENIPEKVERWVVGDPKSNSVVWWYPSEAKALENICCRYCKPIRIEVEML